MFMVMKREVYVHQEFGEYNGWNLEPKIYKYILRNEQIFDIILKRMLVHSFLDLQFLFTIY